MLVYFQTNSEERYRSIHTTPQIYVSQAEDNNPLRLGVAHETVFSGSREYREFNHIIQK